MRRVLALAAGPILLAACSADPAPSPSTSAAATSAAATSESTAPTSSTTTSSPAIPTGGALTEAFTVTEAGTFDEPWAMTLLPGTPYAAITERGGRVLLRDLAGGEQMEVANTPSVQPAGQGGLGDIIAGPNFVDDGLVYLSYVEPGDGDTSGAVVAQARLEVDDEGAQFSYLTVIWRQDPKTTGAGHYSHRLAISPDGTHLFVSSGERQQFDPAQDLDVNLGKILRLDLDGTAADGNPFADRGRPGDEIFSYGHRNVLGLAFDPAGELWASEMGPRGGDELNHIVAGANYGWPLASNGTHYDGRDIPDHTESDGFAAPALWWDPSISPGSLMIYSGDLFPQWRGDAFLGALSGQALVRADLNGSAATKAEQWDAGTRIREVEQGEDGAIWLLEDGPGGRLLRLSPR